MEREGWGLPQIEGHGDLFLFSGEKAKDGHVTAPHVVRIEGSSIDLEAGELHLVCTGIYNLYRPDAAATVSCTGVINITTVLATRSRGQIINNISIQAGDVAKLISTTSAITTITVDNSDPAVDGSEVAVNSLRKFIDAEPLLRLTEGDAEVEIIRNQISGNWKIVAGFNDNEVLPPHPFGLESLLVENLRKFVRARKALTIPTSPECAELDVRVELFRLKNMPQCVNGEQRATRLRESFNFPVSSDVLPDLQAHRLSQGRLVDQSGDSFSFQITNAGSGTVYVAAITFSGDGSISLVYPPGNSAQAEILAPNGRIEFGPIRVFIPADRISLRYGSDNDYIDTLVVYVTTTPEDYAPLLEETGLVFPTAIGRIKGELKPTISKLYPFLSTCWKTTKNPEPTMRSNPYLWTVIQRPMRLLPAKEL